VLVLLIVPALVAAQHDVARQIAAMRRALRAPAWGLQIGLVALWGLVLGWGALTLGFAAVQGALYAPLVQVVPMLKAMSPMPAAFMLFAIGAGIIALGGYIVGAVAMLARGRRTRHEQEVARS
jgi:hypothetical protein